MPSHRSCGTAAALIVLLLTARAAADPAPSPAPGHTRFPAPREVCKPGTEPRICRTFGPGHFLTDEAWIKLDAEVVRLQTVETRLVAENQSLRKTASGWQPGWRVLAGVLVSGVTAGIVLGARDW